jgi:hypothetical protein
LIQNVCEQYIAFGLKERVSASPCFACLGEQRLARFHIVPRKDGTIKEVPGSFVQFHVEHNRNKTPGVMGEGLSGAWKVGRKNVQIVFAKHILLPVDCIFRFPIQDKHDHMVFTADVGQVPANRIFPLYNMTDISNPKLNIFHMTASAFSLNRYGKKSNRK